MDTHPPLRHLRGNLKCAGAFGKRWQRLHEGHHVRVGEVEDLAEANFGVCGVAAAVPLARAHL